MKKEVILKSISTVAAVAVGTIAASPAFAIETGVIETAMTDGQSAVTTVVGGLIALVAVMVGVGIVMSLMKRA